MKEIVGSITKNYLLNHKTIQKIKSKNCILQFLPDILMDISKINKIEFNKINLKTTYIIDMIHSLLFKFYTTGENSFILNSLILKDRYSKNYNEYINYLVDNKYIRLVKDYSKGKCSREYELTPLILKSSISRYKNTDTILLKKHKDNLLNLSFSSENNSIEPGIKQKLINDLYSVDIKLDNAIFFINSNAVIDSNIYNKNLYSSEAIKDGDIFYHFDKYGRMHTNFTTLKSYIRKNCLLIDGGSTCELDIKNSQPLFLVKMMIDSKSKWIKEDELEFFKQLTYFGTYYDYMIKEFNLKGKLDAKELTYSVLFGKNNLRNKWDRMFNSRFPSIYNFIKLYKKENNDYRSMSYKLQKMESEFIFNKLVKTIMNEYPDVRIITVHDSIMFRSDFKNDIEKIFLNKLGEEFPGYPTRIKRPKTFFSDILV